MILLFTILIIALVCIGLFTITLNCLPEIKEMWEEANDKELKEAEHLVNDIK